MTKGITYHIITITAVFAALGLGILIGSLMNGEKLLSSQQTRILNQMGERLSIISKENSDLKKELKKMSEEIASKNELIEKVFNGYTQVERDEANSDVTR